MRKFKLIVPSFIALIFCALLLAGSTFALFTSQAEASISVTSGRVKVEAYFDSNSDALQVYSAESVSDEAYALLTGEDAHLKAGVISSGNFAGNYKYAKQTRYTLDGEKTYHLFANNADNEKAGALLVNNELTLTRMTPGDRVNATLKLENKSNVNIKYRLRVFLVSGLDLYEALQIKLDGVLLQGVNKVGTWTYLETPTTEADNMTDVKVEVVLPLLTEGHNGGKLQDLSSKIKFVLEAVQGNAATTNETLNTNINVQQEVDANETQQVVKDTDELVTVTVPTSALPSATQEDTTTSLAVKVEPQTTESNLVLTSLQTAQSYDLEVLVTTQVGEQAAQTEKYNKNNNAEAAPLKVKMFVGTGLKGVELYHKDVKLTAQTSEAAVDQLNEFFYNEETGYITLMTNSFSEYTVVYNKDLVVEDVNETTNESTFTVYSATNTQGVYQTEVVDEQTGETSIALASVATNQETGEVVITETGTEISEEGLGILDLATEVEFGEGYMLATLTDGVVYCVEDGLTYVYDATDYNGYYGEEELDPYTFYAGKLIKVDGLMNAFNNNDNIVKLVICSDIVSAYKALENNLYITRINFEEGTTYIPNRLTFASSVEYVHMASTTKEIAHHAFYNSPKMFEVRVPESVTKIGEQAFCSCASLETVIIFGSPAIDQYYLGRDDTILSEVWFLGENTTFINDKVNVIFSNYQHNNTNDIDIYFASQAVLDAYEAKCGTHPGVEFHLMNDGPYVFGDEPMEVEEGSF